GHLRLGKLIYLYDQNHITLSGATDMVFTEDVAKRFQAYGWHTRPVADGNDIEEVAKAIRDAQQETERPSLILVRTHIGFGSPKKQDTFGVHGSPLGEEELAAAKKALGWPTTDKFYLPQESVDHFRQAVGKGAGWQESWNERFQAYQAAFPAEAAEFETIVAGRLPEGWNADLPKWQPADKAIATRVAGGQSLNALAKRIPNIVGGSADLNPSTDTALKGLGDFQPPDFAGPGTQGAVGGPWGHAGHNMAFGVREHAMGAAVNGMAAHGGVLPFGASFMVFSDYVKPSIRLAALSGLKCVYVFTHDSVGVGEDGPTHEPVEQLAGLRAIPGLNVMRPADPNEAAETWAFAVQHNGPTLIALTRQSVPHLDRSRSKGDVSKGAYVLSDAEGAAPEVILIGTGSEVALCVKAQAKLQEYGLKARVVSMPSWNLFEAQDEAYRESVLPKAMRKRVTVEAGATFGWHKWAGDEGTIIGLDRFGASAPGEEILRNLGFTAEHVTAAALRLLGRAAEADKEYKP
ncbi:MAG TPA: transketolase, partial [Candidatus Sulfopaludibacter sp.]|nr:transketolase [Candidatus Sulfopaludibacter sp.]